MLLGVSFFLVPSGEAGITAPAILGIAFMAFFNTWLPYNFYVAGMKYISAAKASILSNFELVITVLLGSFLDCPLKSFTRFYPLSTTQV